EVTGSTTVRYGKHTLEFLRFQRLNMREAILRYWPTEAGPAPSQAELATAGGPRKAADRYNAYAGRAGRERIAVKGTAGDGVWTGLLFEAIAEEHLIQPTLLYDFPTEISPLSKQKPDDASLTERFEVFAGGLELGNAFSELNDPEEQERRFLA